MPPKGSNDLNALLKAKVVKLKAELDIKGSMPTIRKQVDDITNKLKTKPVKLMAKLDIKLKDILPQVKRATEQLEKHPLKLKVNIDVAGSATNIKKQLEEVYKTVEDFNKKYGKQLEQMQERAQRARKSASDSMGNVTVPTDGLMGGFNVKQYASQLKEAEQMLKQTFGKGLFSSVEFKDAEGNLQGFIAQLTKADGVVHKISYNWNQELGMFQVVNQQTMTNTEKNVHKAVNALKELEREIIKLGEVGNKFWSEYNRLQEQGNKGTLTPNLVADLKRRIKDEQVLQQEIAKENKFLQEQERLIYDIKQARRDSKYIRMKDFRELIGKAESAKSTDELKTIRFEMEKLLDSNKRILTLEKERNKLINEREKLLNQIKILETRIPSTPSTGSNAELREELTEVKLLTQKARTLEDIAKLKQRINNIKTDNIINEQDYKTLDALSKFRSLGTELERYGIPTKKFMEDLQKFEEAAELNVKDVERLYDKYLGVLRRKQKEIAYLQREIQKGTDITDKYGGTEAIKELEKHVFKPGGVDKEAIQSIQEYIGKMEKAKVATLSFGKDSVDPTGRRVRQFTVTFESAGKTAKQVTYSIAQNSNILKETERRMVYNANRNLGVIEQLKIAMARVPVWMAATTAFYGSIHAIQAMTDQILQLDEALTELRRVANANLSIDTLFQGAVQLSNELGNNIHDILASMNEFARTFGDFNERQLLTITKTATLMSNVSDLTAQEATQNLVSTMNAFNITAEKSIHIVDALNEVDNNYAVSTKQLADGLSKSASVASTFGVSLEQNIGHIAAVSAVTQESGDVIGNALKTIYSRITTMKDAKEVLQSVGVAITKIGQDGQESVRPVSEILDELATKWDGLNDAQKQDIAIKVAGRYQLSRFLALMNNYDMALQATKTATNSQGSAMRENAKYMQSFEARINKLRNAFTELSSAVGDAILSDGMMAVISLLGGMAKIAIEVTKNFGALPIVFGTISLVLSRMGMFGKITDILAEGLAAFNTEMKTTMTTTGGIRGVLAGASAGFSALTATIGEATAATRIFSITWKSALASTLIGAAFAAFGFAVEKFMHWWAEEQRKAEELKKTNDSMIKAFHEHGNSLDSLIARYDELKNKQNKSGQELEEYERIQKDLASSFPTIVEYVDANGKAHLKSTEAIKKEIEAVKQLSQEQADLVNSDHNSKIEEQTQAYQDAVDKLKELQDKQKEILESKNQFPNPVLLNYGMPRDYNKELQQNKVDIMMQQAEITEVIKKTIKTVQELALAYLEANGKLSGLGDASQSAVEKFVSANEQLLRTKGVTKETQEELFKLATTVGEVFDNAYKQMSKGITDTKQLDLIKEQLNDIAKALPEDFFNLDRHGNIQNVAVDLQKVLDVTNQIAQGSTDLQGLTEQLQYAGFTANEAGGFILKLAKEHDNAALRAQAQAQGIEEVTGALEDLNQKTIESIDLTQALFGYNSKDLQAMQSHIQALQVLKQVYGENATKTQQWSDSLSTLSDFLGVTQSEIASNLNHYNLVIDALTKLKVKTDDYGRTTLDLTDLSKREQSVINDVIRIMKNKGIQVDILTGETHKLADAEKKVTDNIQNVGNQADTTSGKLVNVKNKFKDMDGVNLKDAKNQLKELGNQADNAKDKVAGIKLPDWKDADGVNKATNQLKDMGNQADNVKGKAQNLINQLANAQSKSQTTLAAIQNVNQQLDQIGQKSANLNKVKDGIQGIANVSQNTSLGQIESAITKVGSAAGTSAGSLNNYVKIINSAASAFAKLASSSRASASSFAGIANALKVGLSSAKSYSDAISKTVSASSKSANASKQNASAKRAEASAFAQSAARIKEMSSSYNKMASTSASASAKIKGALAQQKQVIGQLQQVISQLASLVANAFTNMTNVVKSRTSAMISTHNSQKSAIDKLTSAAQTAKSAIENLNSSARNAMATLNSYIAKARAARSAGSSVPSVPSAHANSLTIAPSAFSSESVVSAVSAFTASSGDAVGGFGGGDGGASGTIRPSIYEGGINSDGDYGFIALARRRSSKRSSGTTEPLPEKYVVDPEERLMTIYEGLIRKQETILQRMTKASAAYRDVLKQIIYYENLKLAVDKKELAQTQARNEQILKRIKYLDSLKKQTAAQREEYNKLQQEYDSNLSKIASLQGEIESITNSIREYSIELFTDFINEIVAKYDKAIDAIKSKVDDTNFKIDVLTLTQPDNIKDLLNAQIEKENELKKQQEQESNKVSELTNQYEAAKNQYGADSEQAKAVKEELDKAKKELQDTTLAVLNAEKEIKDTRAKVADEAIKQLQEYYKNMKTMAIDAIEAEKEHLQKAHEEKMKMYDDEINKINSVYDEKLKAMDKEKAEADYQKQLDEKNAKKAELLNKISAVSRDNSLEGRKRLADLQDQLAQLDKEIADFQKAHQDELLRQSIEDQKKQQIDAINAKKDQEKDQLDAQLERLDAEKEAVSKQYDDLINNDKMWADMRDQAIKGNFKTLQTELEKMKQNLDNMNRGIFDGLTESFSSFSDEVKKQIIEMNELLVDNMLFNSQDAINYVNQLTPIPIKNPFAFIPRRSIKNPMHIMPISPKQPSKKPIQISPISSKRPQPIHSLLDASKILDKIREFVPNISINSIADNLATVGAISTTNNNYGDIYITVENGDKKKATDIVKEIMVELKKKGK